MMPAESALSTEYNELKDLLANIYVNRMSSTAASIPDTAALPF